MPAIKYNEEMIDDIIEKEKESSKQSNLIKFINDELLMLEQEVKHLDDNYSEFEKINQLNNHLIEEHLIKHVYNNIDKLKMDIINSLNSFSLKTEKIYYDIYKKFLILFIFDSILIFITALLVLLN